jgi:hypothetical protein
VNWAVDLRPYIAKGFSLAELVARPLLHHEFFVMGYYTLQNKDLAIMKLKGPCLVLVIE